jgi:peptidoglycan hydrolase CwlO-like protein
MKKVYSYLLATIVIVSILLTPINFSQAVSSCPSTMNPDSIECLDYLRKKLAEINSQQGSLQKNLNNEQYQQLSLQEKISYINNQIAQTESSINLLEVEIAAKDLEIKLLNKEIQIKEDNLSVLKQETDVLKDTANKRITESYKYSFIGPFELFLDSRNIDTVLRKTKYLLETRVIDK